MTSTSTGVGAMLCGYCGRPMITGVLLGGRLYHQECTQPPKATTPYPLTEDDVRRILREELQRAKEQL